MASPTGVWRPAACTCGKPFGPKSVAIWNGKAGRESAFVCAKCWIKERKCEPPEKHIAQS